MEKIKLWQLILGCFYSKIWCRNSEKEYKLIKKFRQKDHKVYDNAWSATSQK